MEKVWSVQEILQWTGNKFQARGFSSPLLDAQLLLCHVMNFSKVQLYTECRKPLSDAERDKMRLLVKRRLKGEPVAYILGKKDWHDLTLKVTSDVLIPRPETETLLDITLQQLPENPRAILDLCTGSGCLAIALKKAYPNARVMAVDISARALEVAQENASIAAVDIEFLQGDVTADALFQDLKASHGTFDCVVSNPPYVSPQEWDTLDTGVKDFEPKLALVADKGGLAVAEQMLSLLFQQSLLAKNLFLCLELAETHPQKLVELNDFEVSSKVVHEHWRILSADFPIGHWVSLDDLSGKHRFLALKQAE